MHGTKKTPTWTMLDVTVNPGDTSITTIAVTNWQIND
jgi:hypothetical protein